MKTAVGSFGDDQPKNRAFGESVSPGNYVDRGGTDYFRLPKKSKKVPNSQRFNAQLRNLSNSQFKEK